MILFQPPLGMCVNMCRWVFVLTQLWGFGFTRAASVRRKACSYLQGYINCANKLQLLKQCSPLFPSSPPPVPLLFLLSFLAFSRPSRQVFKDLESMSWDTSLKRDSNLNVLVIKNRIKEFWPMSCLNKWKWTLPFLWYKVYFKRAWGYFLTDMLVDCPSHKCVSRWRWALYSHPSVPSLNYFGPKMWLWKACCIPTNSIHYHLMDRTLKK